MDSLYSEAAYYRMLFAERTHDIAFYLRATEGADDVLELGVGDGRVALALAARGRSVLGVDRSAPMLAALEERRAEAGADARRRVEAILGDARTLRLGRRFARVICPFNGLAHFHDREALRDFFDTVRAHLTPDGRLVLDVMIPDPALLVGGASSVPRLVHPRTRAVCRLEERYEYDAVAQVLTITTTLIERERGERQVLALSLRQIFPQEMLALLDQHGFEVLERTPLGDSIGYVCRAREKGRRRSGRVRS